MRPPTGLLPALVLTVLSVSGLMVSLAGPVAADEAPAEEAAEETPAEDVEARARRVATWLQADDAALRARGQRAVADALAAPQEAAPFLEALAEALREAPARAATPPAGPAAEREPPAEPSTAPPAEGTRPDAPSPSADVTLEAIRIPRREVAAWIADDAAARADLGVGHAPTQGAAHPVTAEVASALRALPDARRVDLVPAGPDDEGAHAFVHGQAPAYRRALRRTAKDAWAVVSDRLPPPLEVRIRPGAETLAVETRWARLPTEPTTRRVRPAPDVAPIELDEPEWEVVRLETTVPRPTGTTPAWLLVRGLPDEALLLLGITTH